MKLIFSLIFFMAVHNAHADVFVNCGQETNAGDYFSMVADWETDVLNAGIRQSSLEDARQLARRVIDGGLSELVVQPDLMTVVAGAQLIELVQSPTNLRACAIFEGSIQAF